MKRLVLSMTTAVGMLVASSAFAALTWSSSASLKITKVDIEGDPTSNTAPHTLWLQFSAAPMTVNCSGGAGWWKVVGDPAAVEAIRAAALSAKLGDLPVKVLFQNSYSGTQSCDGGGTTGSPLLRGFAGPLILASKTMNRPKSESPTRARGRPSRAWSATATTLIVGAAVLGCGSAEEPLQNTSQLQPISWEEFRASAFREPGPNGRFIVDGDIPLEDEAELREYYDSWTPPGALTVSQVFGSGEDNIWPFPSSLHLTYCIGSSTGANKAMVVAEMEEATKSWSAMAGVRFEYVPSEDASCNSSNNNVTFDVQEVPNDGPNAVSFFPDEPRSSRTLAIRPVAYTTTAGGRDFQGILRHELGHSLGFRHEHIWLDPDCPTSSEQPVSGGYDARIVNSYDVDSVMHYPQCRPSGTGGYRQTALDYGGAVALYHLSAQRIAAAITL